jgi:copper(I)-binding protein
MRWPDLAVLLLSASIVPFVTGAGPAGPVELSRPWAAPAALGGDTSVMFQLQNFGPVRDDLILAGCATAESAELVGPGTNGGPPVRLNEIGLGPGQSMALTPGGVHLVLHHLQRAARVGDTLHCTATFGRCRRLSRQ